MERGAEPTLRPPDPQTESPFFRLPLELRDDIYARLFSSTRLLSGAIRHWYSDVRLLPIFHALALLRTCRRIHADVGDRWLGWVLFSFENAEALLDKLADLNPATRARIRHVCVGIQPLHVWAPAEPRPARYTLASVFQLLPGLRLARLTVVSPFPAIETYETLSGLVAEGHGWQELCYVANGSTFLAYPEIRHGDDDDSDEPTTHHYRDPQPAGWQSALDRRDSGVSSHPGAVSIYRFAQDAEGPRDGPVCILARADLSDRDLRARGGMPFAQQLGPSEDLAAYRARPDTALLAEGERAKQVLIIVRRGRGVDFAVPADPAPPLHGHADLRTTVARTMSQLETTSTTTTTSWAAYKAWMVEIGSHGLGDGDALPTLRDDFRNYEHVDDFLWPQFRSS